MNIQKNLTTCNYEKMTNKKNLYIVCHYTANNGDTARSNTNYFKNTYRGSSAHYFVDETSVWQSVLDTDKAWHCGTTGTYYHKYCRNSNSIGVEMCSVIVNGVYQIPEKTIQNAVWLIKQLMSKYNIPINNVIRHYDVTHKLCPRPFVDFPNQWEDFKQRLVNNEVETNVNKHWCEDIKNILLSKKIITDDSQWSQYDDYTSKGLFMTLVDNATGGRWETDEQFDHWAGYSLASLMGKRIITDKSQWVDYDSNIPKSLALALVDNATGGMDPKYAGVTYNHWCLNCLNSLCDKAIIESPEVWDNHWDEPLLKSECMALIYKSFFK